MLRFLSNLFDRHTSPQTTSKARLALEPLDRRDVPSITYVSDGGFNGRVDVVGDGSNDIVFVSNKTNDSADPYDDQLVVTRSYGGSGPSGPSAFSESATYSRYVNLPTSSGTLHIPRGIRVVAELPHL